MSIVQWVTFLGIPSLCTVIGFITKKIFEQSKKIDLLMSAYQVCIRDRLMEMYHKCKEINCISDDDLEMFEALYQAYHSLGKNGVMDSRREEVLSLTKVPHYEKKN